MAQLAIKGHINRGQEVIQLLEMLGGKNIHRIDAIRDCYVYFVMDDKNETISTLKLNQVLPEQFIIYSLEEFLEKYPYKVGDKVNAPCRGCIKTITSMWWDTYLNTITYKLDHRIYTNIDQLKVVNDLQTYKEENMEERKYADLRLDVDQDDKLATEVTIDGDKITPPENYLIGKITKVDNGVLVEFVKKQPQYPKDYMRCCDCLGHNPFSNNVSGYKRDVIESLQTLITCRDTYWKIAGKQLGLGKPWEPEWESEIEQKYTIVTDANEICSGVTIQCNAILAFPTEEMRDAFYENFNGLIEQCKELL